MNDYFTRKMLVGLGFQAGPMGDLSYQEILQFQAIESAIEHEKKRNRRGGKGKGRGDG